MKEKIDLFELYDSINTLAVKWLTYQHRSTCKALGIANYDSSNITHLWFLHILESYRIYNNYVCYFVDCGFFEYLYLRFIKRFKGARRKRKNEAIMIDVDIFVDELIENFKEHVPDITSSIIKRIYDEYWG